MRHELTDEEWTAIRPMLPNKARGVPKAVLTVPKTDFRSSLNNGHQTSGAATSEKCQQRALRRLFVIRRGICTFRRAEG